MNTPIGIATAATSAFIESHVPRGASVIEIGCGAGDVTATLARHGYKVTGIDSDAALVSRAQQSGVDLVLASWPDFDSDWVDAVVFTRSLHHISPLQEAVAKIVEVLKPSGCVLVEDFAFDEAEKATILWFFKFVRSQAGRSLISRTSDEFVTALLEADDPVGAWANGHDHGLHTAQSMKEAIAERFVIREFQRVPYLYRYLIPVLPQSPEAAAFVEKTYREEARLGELGEISLIGRRIVAQAP